MILDEVLPHFDVAKTHRLILGVSSARSFAALRDYDLHDSGLIRTLMRLRGYGRRMRGVHERAPLTETLTRFGFVLLGENPGHELAFGLVGRFWRTDGGLRPVSASEFGKFAEPGYAKAAWNLLVEAEGAHRSVLSTETRVLCLSEEARRKFLFYWRLIEPFSGLIRIALLRGVRRRAERTM